MVMLSTLRKIALLSLGAVGGSVAHYHIDKVDNSYDITNSWTRNNAPNVKWDSNWDHRDPESIVEPLVTESIFEPLVTESKVDENKYKEQIENAKSKAVRHLFLIRHGQYNHNKERNLTELGRQQADLTGERLASLNIKWNLIVRSTVLRAQETANIIQEHLPEDIEVRDCQLIEEGVPICPVPPTERWIPDRTFFRDSARIEAAFRRYFFRAPPEQVQDSYMMLVCHANVIRFFVCRALQFPPEGWYRMSLTHCSITWLTILPNGEVILQSLSDSGHMEPKYITK